MATRKNEWFLLVPWRKGGDGDLAVPEQALDAPSASHIDEPLAVSRCFAFLDISGFTAYCDRHGEQRAIEVLAYFRETTRAVAARRGVRVAKWLGDGVMLVGLESALVAAAVGEIALRCEAAGLDTHAGVATGSVLMFEGDDYVGRSVNLAARLCDRAELGEVLTAGPLPHLPEWLVLDPVELCEVPGVEELVAVQALHVDEAVRDGFLADRVA